VRFAVVAWHVVKGLPYPLLAASAVGWMLLAVVESVPSLPALCISPATAGDVSYALVWLGAELVLVSGWLLLGSFVPAAGPVPFAIAAVLALTWQATPL
jgi:hypothetical protein